MSNIALAIALTHVVSMCHRMTGREEGMSDGFVSCDDVRDIARDLRDSAKAGDGCSSDKGAWLALFGALRSHAYWLAYKSTTVEGDQDRRIYIEAREDVENCMMHLSGHVQDAITMHSTRLEFWRMVASAGWTPDSLQRHAWLEREAKKYRG